MTDIIASAERKRGSGVKMVYDRSLQHNTSSSTPQNLKNPTLPTTLNSKPNCHEGNNFQNTSPPTPYSQILISPVNDHYGIPKP